MASTEDLKPASAGNVKAAINTTMDNLKQAMGGGYLRDLIMPNHDAGGQNYITFYAEDGLYDHLEIAAYFNGKLKTVNVPFEDNASVKDGSSTFTLDKQAASTPIWTLTASGNGMNFYRVIGIK